MDPHDLVRRKQAGRRREVARVALRVPVQRPVNAFGSGSRDAGRGLVERTARAGCRRCRCAGARTDIPRARQLPAARPARPRSSARACSPTAGARPYDRVRLRRARRTWGGVAELLKRACVQRLKRVHAQRLRRGSPARPKRRTGIEPASSPWKGEALPLSYRRAREPASQGGSPTMTVCTNHLARVDLVEDRLPAAVAERGGDTEVLGSEVVELEDQRIGLATVRTRAFAEQLDEVGRSLCDQRLFASDRVRDVAVAVLGVVRSFVVCSAWAAVVVALPARLSAPGEVGAWLRSLAASAGRR